MRMTEKAPVLKPIDQIKKEYENIRDAQELHTTTAMSLLRYMEGAVDYFELGLRLGRETPGSSKDLTVEIEKYIKERKQQLMEQLFPATRGLPGAGTGSMKQGG